MLNRVVSVACDAFNQSFPLPLHQLALGLYEYALAQCSGPGKLSWDDVCEACFVADAKLKFKDRG